MRRVRRLLARLHDGGNHPGEGPSSLPPTPLNVRVQTPDGIMFPVELTYEGLDDRGCHLWVAVPTTPNVPIGSRLWVDELPARTAITVRTRVD